MGSFNPTKADLKGTVGLSAEKKAANAKGKTKGEVAAKPAAGERAKTECAVSKATFLSKAGSLSIKIGESIIDGDSREFSTGSFGWFVSGKATVMIDGKPVKCQVGCNVIVIGSKDAK